MRGTQEKARYHLERAEYWQSKVMEFEDAAEEKAKSQQTGRMRRSDGSQLEVSYTAGVLLRDHHGYNNACANRNSHQRQAEIYCLAAMAGIRGTSWDRIVDGRLVQVED